MHNNSRKNITSFQPSIFPKISISLLYVPFKPALPSSLLRGILSPDENTPKYTPYTLFYTPTNHSLPL